jgi:hypothetical protein
MDVNDLKIGSYYLIKGFIIRYYAKITSIDDDYIHFKIIKDLSKDNMNWAGKYEFIDSTIGRDIELIKKELTEEEVFLKSL